MYTLCETILLIEMGEKSILAIINSHLSGYDDE